MNHTIQVAAKLSGLTPHAIRAWERRYGAIKPNRSNTNRRLYSELEVEKLGLLRQATDAGHSISQVAALEVDQLRQLIAANRETLQRMAEAPSREVPAPAERYTQQAIGAIKAFNSGELERVLREAAVELGYRGLLTRIVAPLAQEVGELWYQGIISAAHEHFATSAIKVFLIGSHNAYALPDSAPVLVAGTISGQLHELGAVLTAAAASSLGWRVTYLGPNLPALEIAGAARQNDAEVVALSIVYPPDDPELPVQIANLRQLLPPRCAVVIGGRVSQAYSQRLAPEGITHCESLDDFYRVLDQVRRQRLA